MLNQYVALICASLLAGCASHGSPALRNVSQESVARMLRPGTSTKADVERTFGRARINQFDSGYEVWTYRHADTPPAWLARGSSRHAKELVILLDPSGVVTKMRVSDVTEDD
jgi:hypothetical protein